MANGFDRLERFFAYKRKASPSPSRETDFLTRPLEQQFPSPSFIRPKTSRMTARQEVHLRQVVGRSPSVPDVSMTRSVSSCGHGYQSCSTDSAYKIQRKPVRLAFFSQNQRDQLNDALRDFQFPKPPSCNGSISPQTISFNSFMLNETPCSPGSHCPSTLESAIHPDYRLDTPPSSDSEDNVLNHLSRASANRKIFPPNHLPTPALSPRMAPLSDARLRKVSSADGLDDKALYKAIEDQLGESFDDSSLNRTYSQSSVAASAHSFCSSILREPDFNEFLNLSDDDIAESSPPSPVLPPTGYDSSSLPHMDLSISSSEPLECALLTLTPPRASRPAAVAAFEAARIARRYDFDLVYVVNLWPSNLATAPADNVVPNNGPMLGRLLAAHGLHHVPSPLQISSDVHKTILRSDGWIEYQNRDATFHDLARGYACAFYSGQYCPSTSSSANSLVSGVRLSQQIDRGIVFAGYRKPREDNGRLGRKLSEEELGELHKEAEVLIEMVLDIHVAKKSRLPPTRSSLSDETGPMPAQQAQFS